jgi:hypothetical protein
MAATTSPMVLNFSTALSLVVAAAVVFVAAGLRFGLESSASRSWNP